MAPNEVVSSRRLIRTLALVPFLAILAQPGPPASALDEEPPAPSVEVAVMHNAQRCLACLRLEEYTRETLDRHFKTEVEKGRVTSRTVEIQGPGSERFVSDHGVTSPTVVISLRGEGREVAFRKLDYLRALTNDEEKFTAALFREIESLLRMRSDR